MASTPRASATPLAVAALMAVVILGCSSQATASPTPLAATATLLPAATASPAPTASPTPTPEPFPQGSEPVVLDPAGFVALIDNQYWPLIPGSRWVYQETDADGAVQKVAVTVTNETKVILGITATVVRD